MGVMRQLAVLLTVVVVITTFTTRSEGALPTNILEKVLMVNKKGPFLGLVVPNSFEMSPLLQSSKFVRSKRLPCLDFGGRRFRFGRVEKEKVIIVMTGLSMLNAGISTQLLLTLFDVKGVVHFGVAGNANPDLQIGDVTIPKYWAHTGLWNWQRFGDGPNAELSFESSGDYTRTIGHLNFSDFDINKNDKNFGNSLNSVWYQPEEVFPVSGVPEVRERAFWVSVDHHYFALSEKLEGMKLTRCINSTTCLKRIPVVKRVEGGCSANVFVDNAEYSQFLRSKFNVTPIDMESAAVALICLQQQVPFIAVRALSDLAGGGSSKSNEASVFGSLAAQNAVDAVTQFISLLA
ncbi:bark storage protein A [Phoenix dactylifera]|uniref:Bark storage protein A n=1 Tax=Phoenix dactylifera TaxID=42345 RepID=A0A8B7BQM4_PHODC|nr:bark storage protein A [Phoenix dactylifera]